MLKIVCDKCQEEIPEHSVNDHMSELKELGITNKWRIRQISNDIRDGRQGGNSASDEEKRALFQFGHELIALAVYQPTYCEKCATGKV